MSIISCFGQIDWIERDNKSVAEIVYFDACEYWKRVIDHIYKGNEIRADKWMDYSEKQEEIKMLDRKRTNAHNKLLVSASDLIDLLNNNTEFDKSNYSLDSRTQIADFIALIAFELIGLTPSSMVEGSARDELAELIHNGTISTDQIKAALAKTIPEFE